LGDSAAPDALGKIVGDLRRNGLEWKHAALDVALEPYDVKAIAGRDRFGTERAGLKRLQRLLEFRFAVGDLSRLPSRAENLSGRGERRE
jgi:hypothetical protein